MGQLMAARTVCTCVEGLDIGNSGSHMTNVPVHQSIRKDSGARVSVVNRH